MTRKALITGITGQDGSYLAEMLLAKGYEVHGLIRRASTFNTERLSEIFEDVHNPASRLFLRYGDLDDASTVHGLVSEVVPDELYHLGAQSHVRVSFDIPEYTGNVTGLGTMRLLEAVRGARDKSGKQIRFYQASSSELYGLVQEVPQRETTPFYPRSPYACAKLYAFWATKNYRESYGLFASNGILFNHESPRRGETFVTRKITRAVARIKEDAQDCLYLGNLEAKRDWGHARDFVEAMWLIMQQDKPDDFVVATGETHSVREFLEESFRCIGLEVESNGKSGNAEEYIRKDSGKAVVRIDPRYYRPAEVDLLLGDAGKAKRELGWAPKVRFRELVGEMVEADSRQVRTELYGTRGR